MKKLICLAIATLFAASIGAADTNSMSAAAELKYSAALEGRTADILKVLNLSDSGKAAKVHDLIIAQYRALNAWHSDNDANLKAARRDTNAVAQIRASLKVLHDDFISRLGEYLTPEEVDKVKDKMTYGKVQFTFAGYVTQYPNLPEADQNEILKLLKQAREEAMDGGSAAEKTAIFQRYKGRINNYLSKQGIQTEKKKASAPVGVTNSAPERQ
jgi:hypothetical protein